MAAPPRRPADFTPTLRSVRDDGDGGVVRRALMVMTGDNVTVHDLPADGEVTIGRGSDSAVCVDHPTLSRAHVTLRLGPQVEAIDLDSANGTFVRGARLPAGQPVEVAPYETLVAGDVTLVVQEVRAPAAGGDAARRPSGPVGRGAAPLLADPAMRRLYEVATRVARGAIGVLIVGETGAGKEVLAEFVHRSSPRAVAPLVRINCAGLPESLIESELFGHVRGAFTGADQARAGLIEAADGGTVLLDEVGELSPGAQAKLLRVLEDGRVTRLGASEPSAVDVRFVAATNRDLAAEVEADRFRRDLYYRLAGVVLAVPPLRARTDEIEPLARAFATEAAARLGAPAPALTDDAVAALRGHAWPGNVRELRAAMERTVLVADGAIDAAALALGPAPAAPAAPAAPEPAAPEPAASAPAASAPLADELADLERRRIVDALEQCGGNQTRAAELLGMPRRTLVKRLTQYGIKRPRGR